MGRGAGKKVPANVCVCVRVRVVTMPSRSFGRSSPSASASLAATAALLLLLVLLPCAPALSEGEQDHPLLAKLSYYEIHDISEESHSGRRLMQESGASRLEYTLEAFSRTLELELTKNVELFAPDYQHYHVHGDNDHRAQEANLDCFYKVKVRGDTMSRGSMSLCGPGMRAKIYAHGDWINMQPVDSVGHRHAIFRNNHIIDKGGTCGVKSGESSAQTPQYVVSAPDDKSLRSGHAHAHAHADAAPVSLAGLIADINGDASPAHTARTRGRNLLTGVAAKIVKLVVVNDHARFLQQGAATHQHAATLIQEANDLFDGLAGDYSITLQIVSMYTFSIKDPYHDALVSDGGYDGNGDVVAAKLLDQFNNWRQGNAQPSHGLAHLLVGTEFQGDVIGLAKKPGLCFGNQRAGITQATNMADPLVVSTMTHEIGHNLGMEHTDEPYTVATSFPAPPGINGASCTPTAPPGSSCCAVLGTQYIMDSASTGQAHVDWSACSTGWLTAFIEKDTSAGLVYYYPDGSMCAESAAASGWSAGPVCGDGLREGSEECDCPNKNCAGIDPCCDGNTCTLLGGSECSALDGCCDESCNIITDNSHVCREAVTECDITEKCDGVNAACPVDGYKDTGVECVTPSPSPGGIAGRCYFKECYSHAAQCASYSNISPTVPTLTGDCPSHDEDDLDESCGVLWCTSNSGCLCLSSSCTNPQPPSVFVQDGTPCGTGKSCYAGACVAYAEIPIPGALNCTNGVQVCWLVLFLSLSFSLSLSLTLVFLFTALRVRRDCTSHPPNRPWTRTTGPRRIRRRLRRLSLLRVRRRQDVLQ